MMSSRASSSTGDVASSGESRALRSEAASSTKLDTAMVANDCVYRSKTCGKAGKYEMSEDGILRVHPKKDATERAGEDVQVIQEVR
jgi:hypothetical protein